MSKRRGSYFRDAARLGENVTMHAQLRAARVRARWPASSPKGCQLVAGSKLWAGRHCHIGSASRIIVEQHISPQRHAPPQIFIRL